MSTQPNLPSWLVDPPGRANWRLFFRRRHPLLAWGNVALPDLAAKYGGGMFLFVYLVLVFTIGISLLLLENALGRKTGQSYHRAFKAFGKKFTFIGVLMSAVPFIIVPYYCVIGGWVTKYLAAYAGGEAGALVDGGTYFTNFIGNGPESILFMLIFMAITYFIVGMGVNNGLEKANFIMMPALIVVAAILAVYALTMPGAIDGLAFYLVPDFSKFSPELVIAALGQTFFTLSLAMGIMVTYGSYLDKATKLEAVAENSGPSLMFIVLPQVFEGMGSFAPVVGAGFFVLVLFAALTSALSLVETCTSIVQDATHCSRGKALATVIVWTTLMGLLVTLGYSSLSFIEPLGAGTSILDFLDFISNSVMMPIVALLTCIFIGWIVGPKMIEEEVMLSSRFRLRKVWVFMIKYLAPVALVVILVAYVAQTFGFFSMYSSRTFDGQFFNLMIHIFFLVAYVAQTFGFFSM